MKRGLVVEAAEQAPGIWAERLDRVRARMREEGVAVALVYGDVYRSDDIAHLTNLCIYWNEGLIAVPDEGDPALLTKLSPRVHPWMRRTSTLEDLRSGRDVAALVSAFLDGRPAGRLGIADRDWWPAALLADIERALPEWQLHPVPDLVREARLTPDEVEREQLAAASELVGAAVAEAVTGERSGAERVAAVELVARAGGAKDVIAHCDRTGDGTVSVTATVQFGNVWAHAARAVDGGDSGWAATLREALSAGAEALRAGVSPAELAAAAEAPARLRTIHHADLGTGGDLRPAEDAERPLPAGAVVALRAEVQLDGAGRAAVADTFVVAGDGAVSLSGTEVAR